MRFRGTANWRLTTAMISEEKCCIKSGARYVHHREALARMLQPHVETLERAGIPIDPNLFVADIASTWREPSHPAYHIIAAAFGFQ